MKLRRNSENEYAVEKFLGGEFTGAAMEEEEEEEEEQRW